jgi:hypothetical protein
MTQDMSYEAARAFIKNGDVISVYTTFSLSLKKIFPTLVRIFTGSPVYHTGMVIWMKSPSGIDRLMMVEAHAAGDGKRLIPLSHYANFKFDVTPCPGDFTKMEELLLSRVADEPYGYFDLISIGLKEFFGIPAGNTKRQVCSELVADVLHQGGVPLPNLNLSPGRLKSDLRALGCTPTISVNM